MKTKKVRLFNTLSRTVEELKTEEPGKAKLYCCGPTVYDYQHIGNMRTYIFEDLLVRTLRYAGYEVEHVMNITDVGHLVSDGDEGEDKMLVAAKREKKSSLEIAAYYTEIFFQDCKKLNITRPNTVCNATEHIQEMIGLIQRLEERGMTYVAGGNVYYDVAQFPDYGKLAKLDLEKLQAGARVDVDSNKKNPQDFVLWFTKSKFDGQELQWDSPWGRGYPGWHIECSAMSMKYLGDTFDIHCGGIDHIPVHHTNEIAQSEGATGKKWVGVWMHGEFLLLDKEKMSKSKGGFLKLSAVEERGLDPLSYRILCLGGHYRSQLSFSWDNLEAASNTLAKLKKNIFSLKSKASDVVVLSKTTPYIEQFETSILEDLNMPKAMAVLWSVLGDSALSCAEKLTHAYVMDQVLGLDMQNWEEEEVQIPQEVQDLAEARVKARAERNWEEADRLREKIKGLGFVAEDSKDGITIKKL